MTETLMDKQAYPATSFVGGKWQQEINVRDFIQKTTLLMMGIQVSWPNRQEQQQSYGKNVVIC